jgi:hypothetical protein
VPGLDVPPDAAPGLPALLAAALFAGYALARRTPLALFGLAWTSLALLPFYLFVPRIGDLYLYLPLAGVAFVVVDAAEAVARSWRPARRAAAALGLGALALWSAGRIHAKSARWHAAGDVVEGVVADVKAARPTLPRGGTLVLEGLPDYVGGVYAFLNAAPSAFWLAYDDRTLNVVRPKPADPPEGPVAARFLYEDERFYEIDASGRRRLLRTFSLPDG